MELKVRNVNEAFSEIFWKFKVLNLEPVQTRNGPALVYPEPVTTIYQKPIERVLFHPERDANPVFHLVEAVWMLAGRRDVKLLSHFNSNMANFSDDGVNFNAAYGYRWRKHFGFDQLEALVTLLKREPTSRQAILQMWEPADLVKDTKDKACNMSAVFEVRDGKLNMTVYNRSNDVWWGAYGANAVHFSVLQEFVALAIGCEVGHYRQVSQNLHLYTELYGAAKFIDVPPNETEYNYYANSSMVKVPLFTGGNWRTFLDDCETFCNDPFNAEKMYFNPFFDDVLRPMVEAYMVRKMKVGNGLPEAYKVAATDWRLALIEWIERREQRKVARTQK